MTKRKETTVQAELPMKDVTPKAAKPADKKTEAAKTKLPKPRAAAKKIGTAVAVPQPKAPAQEKSVLAVIAELGASPNMSPDNMRALLDMQKEIVAEQRRMDFNTAFIALQAELPTIAQDGKIEVRKKDSSGERTGVVQQATPYATFNGIMKAIQPLLTKHGFSLSFATEPTTTGILMVKGFLDHAAGGQRSTAFPLPAESSGSKNNVQGWGSSLSYGKRYCTIALLNIVSGAKEDRDTDGFPGDFNRTKDGGLAEKPSAPLKASPEQLIKLRDAINLNEVPEEKVLDHYSLRKLEDIEARFVDPAIKQCQDYAENLKRNARRG